MENIYRDGKNSFMQGSYNHEMSNQKLNSRYYK